MFLARIVCSDRDCEEEREVVVESLDQLDGYVCECGHGFILESVATPAAEPDRVVTLGLRRPARVSDRRAA